MEEKLTGGIVVELMVTFKGPPGVCKQWYKGNKAQCVGPFKSQSFSNIFMFGLGAVSGRRRPINCGANILGYGPKTAPPKRKASATKTNSLQKP